MLLKTMRLLNVHMYGDMFYLSFSWGTLDLAAGNFRPGQGAIIRANGAYHPNAYHWDYYPGVLS